MIKSPGFFIQSFEAQGVNMEASRIEFTEGCNVVVGKSDTGKTTLFHLIEYVLGDTEDVILSSEWLGYTTFFLELKTAKKDVFTLMRKIGETAILVKKCSILDFYNTSRGDTYGIGANARISISDFLLQLSEVQDAFIKANDKRKPYRLTYPFIRHLLFVDEVRISSDEPSFYHREKSPNPILYQNMFAYLITGEDDRNYVPPEEKKVAQSRVNGKIDYLKEEIKRLQEERDELGDLDYISMSDQSFIDTYRKELSSISGTLDNLYEQQRVMKAQESALESEVEELSFFVNRLGLLKKNYELELKRLEFINQGADYLASLSSNICPICGSDLDREHILNIEHSKYKEALLQEYTNTAFKLKDVSGLILVKEKEIVDCKSRFVQIQNRASQIQNDIERITPNYDILTQMITNAEQNLRKSIKYDQLGELIQRKEEEQACAEKLLAEISKRNSKKNTEKDVVSERYLALLKDVLISMNFISNEDVVSFSLKDFDISINGKPRATYGKGNRAITCTAALIALMDYLIEENRSISRVVVFDSPVCTKYDGNTPDSDSPDNHVLDAFAKFCNDRDWQYQVIILDNKIDSSDQIDENKYPGIHFIEFGTEMRPGLFMTKLNNEGKTVSLNGGEFSLF